MGVAVSALWFSRKAPAQSAPSTAIALQQEAAPHESEKVQFAKRIDQPPPAASRPGAPVAQADPAALDAVKRAIPNIEAASVENGARILREAALAELQRAVQELQARQKEVEEKLAARDTPPSDEQQRIATKQLKELQLEQMEKIKQIAANAKAQLDAFHQLKEAAR